MNFKNKLEELITELSDGCFETSTFGDLKIGDKYIAMPLPGDNHDHGGYKGNHYIYQKTKPFTPFSPTNVLFNTVRCWDGMHTREKEDLLVIKIK